MASILKKLHGDRLIWIIVIGLSMFSLLAIFSSVSALAYSEKHSTYLYLLKQLLFICFGLLVMFGVHKISPSYFKGFATLALIFTIFLLLYMDLFGVTINGAKRWIRIGTFTFMPVDVAKITLVLYLASVLEDNVFDKFKDVLKKIVLPVGAVCLLIFIYDISSTLFIAVICFSILFIGGLKIKYILNIVGLAVAMLALLFILGYTTGWPSRIDTAVSRIEQYLGSNSEGEKSEKELQSAFQSEQSSIAVASGGIIGKGPGNSTQRYFLPHPESDFIYAIIIEEYGFLFGALVLLAYMILLYRAVAISNKCTRVFSSVCVLGLMLMIVFQAMLNMGVSVGILPVTGQTLPFVSMGGSSMLFMGVAFGIILSVSRTADKKELETKQNIENTDTTTDTAIANN